MEYIVSLTNKRMLKKGASEQLGGKAASLMKMCEAGFPVQKLACSLLLMPCIMLIMVRQN